MAKETKWTEKPWRVQGVEAVTIGDCTYRMAVIRSEDERWTALVDIEDAEGEANARLIAKAPELAAMVLAFCDRAVDGGTDSSDWPMVKVRAALVDNARALLAALDGQEG